MKVWWAFGSVVAIAVCVAAGIRTSRECRLDQTYIGLNHVFLAGDARQTSAFQLGACQPQWTTSRSESPFAPSSVVGLTSTHVIIATGDAFRFLNRDTVPANPLGLPFKRVGAMIGGYRIVFKNGRITSFKGNDATPIASRPYRGSLPNAWAGIDRIYVAEGDDLVELDSSLKVVRTLRSPGTIIFAAVAADGNLFVVADPRAHGNYNLAENEAPDHDPSEILRYSEMATSPSETALADVPYARIIVNADKSVWVLGAASCGNVIDVLDSDLRRTRRMQAQSSRRFATIASDGPAAISTQALCSTGALPNVLDVRATNGDIRQELSGFDFPITQILGDG